MNPMRNRVKEHFPAVLLTLLSIVQALALELLWSHLSVSDYLFEASWIAAISWIQILATFLGLILIWVVYASIVMRFRWVPVTGESVYPFLIGLIEFMLIETLGPDEIGFWFMFMALVFAMMFWVTHTNMRRARLDGDNDVFFKNFAPARLRDFFSQISIVSVLALAGVYLLISSDNGLIAMLALLMTIGILGLQFYLAAQFWEQSVAQSTDE